MKTTNLFIDFLVIGFLSLLPALPFTIDYLSASPPDWKVLAEQSSLLLPAIMMIVYILGMLFNQMSSYVITILSKIKVVPSSKQFQDVAFENINTDYHSALQLVITKSSDAYAYLSYRRSIIRIYRALLTSMLFLSITLVISHPVPRLSFDMRNVIAICCFVITVFAGLVFFKNLKGYYSSIAIFFRNFSEDA